MKKVFNGIFWTWLANIIKRNKKKKKRKEKNTEKM